MGTNNGKTLYALVVSERTETVEVIPVTEGQLRATHEGRFDLKVEGADLVAEIDFHERATDQNVKLDMPIRNAQMISFALTEGDDRPKRYAVWSFRVKHFAQHKADEIRRGFLDGRTFGQVTL